MPLKARGSGSALEHHVNTGTVYTLVRLWSKIAYSWEHLASAFMSLCKFCLLFSKNSDSEEVSANSSSCALQLNFSALRITNLVDTVELQRSHTVARGTAAM